MQTIKQTANFFWHGNLSLYEIKCLESFVKHNWEVKVWSYEKISLPNGIELCDASEILPKSELDTFKVWCPHTNSFETRGNINSGFSDLFRFNLLLKKGGWWFDTDVICLRDQSNFVELTKNKHIVAGKEDENSTNGAILNFPDKETNLLILQKAEELCKNTRDLEWGVIGPKLITNFVKEQQLEFEVYPISTFYPIGYPEVDYFYNPDLKMEALRRSSNSYTIHLWNWVLVNRGVNKDMMPKNDCFLFEIFNK